MFINKTLERNPQLIEIAFRFHQELKIEPDTYLVDVDTFLENSKKIIKEANQHQMKMYFMLKQIGRNPYLAKQLMQLGYAGAVVVDYREAECMMKNNIPIANVGHLVQPCHSLLQKLVDYGCEHFTVYSLQKVRDINECAKKANRIQKILIRVVDDGDMIYSAQTAGFLLSELKDCIHEIKQCSYIQIAGVTSFPCFLYDENLKEIMSTHNLSTVLQAKSILEEMGIVIENLNTPSTTSVATIQKMAKYNATSGEPGHGLSGTTPIHASQDMPEIPCVVYLSEVSHNFMQHAYAFGGGHYRRSHLENALVGNSFINYKKMKVLKMEDDSIDYHFELSEEASINDTVIMAFRFQIFVTRSHVCLIEGIHTGNPKIVGTYTSLGEPVDE